MKEDVVEGYLVERVRSMRGEIRKVAWTGRRGAPDRLVMLPGASVFVELKNPKTIVTFPKGDREEAQAREHERLRAAGLNVEVIGTLAGVDDLLQRYALR